MFTIITSEWQFTAHRPVLS